MKMRCLISFGFIFFIASKTYIVLLTNPFLEYFRSGLYLHRQTKCIGIRETADSWHNALSHFYMNLNSDVSWFKKKKKRYKSPAWIERRGFGPPWKILNFLNSHSEVAKKKGLGPPPPSEKIFWICGCMYLK